MGALVDRRHEVSLLAAASNTLFSHQKAELDEKFEFVIYKSPFDASKLEDIRKIFQEEVTRKSARGLRTAEHDLWFGQPIYPSFMPPPLMSFCDTMSFLERFTSVVSYTVTKLILKKNVLSTFEGIKEKRAIQPGKSLSNLLSRPQLHLVISDIRVQELSRPLPPNIIPVGGITAEPAQPLDEKLEEFFERSGPHGVVVISMGTSLSFDESSVQNIAGALSRLEQRVVWNHRGPRPNNIGNNTRLATWLPMNDVLGHPKTKVLVNHGGTSTVLESIYHGVPMVLIPLANDMFDITDRAVCRGVAVKLNMPTLTGSILVDAIQKVISEPRYEQTSSHLSSVFKETTPSPLDTAVFWIEHVIKHGGDYLRPASDQSMSLYQCMSLGDLLITVIGCVAFVKVIFYFAYLCIIVFNGSATIFKRVGFSSFTKL
ncbi:2-hydroxyacylsphingosine 1-beta-galactosyltransferase-like [Acanthaster planci]|uniref:2-hydroxyacylsphingosine 1-beta-galactosyltransferase-like n=1 Tax=Acanthaster planci TaxID=133434 RepID=A0A8B7XI95_ACAPL|nr:2-hydroxyacylsphingosine 1-beta-galactosyltransferase-like [Acanthaster planci]